MFGGLDSGRVLDSRGGIPMSIESPLKSRLGDSYCVHS